MNGGILRGNTVVLLLPVSRKSRQAIPRFNKLSGRCGQIRSCFRPRPTECCRGNRRSQGHFRRSFHRLRTLRTGYPRCVISRCKTERIDCSAIEGVAADSMRFRFCGGAEAPPTRRLRPRNLIIPQHKDRPTSAFPRRTHPPILTLREISDLAMSDPGS